MTGTRLLQQVGELSREQARDAAVDELSERPYVDALRDHAPVLDVGCGRGELLALLRDAGVETELVNKVYEGRPNIVDRMKNGDIAMVLNTTEGAQAIADSREIRSVALYDKIPYFTTAAGAIAAVAAIKSREEGDVGVRTLQG